MMKLMKEQGSGKAIPFHICIIRKFFVLTSTMKPHKTVLRDVPCAVTSVTSREDAHEASQLGTGAVDPDVMPGGECAIGFN